MNKSQRKKNNNEFFCQKIFENKDILFGKHSTKITQEEKAKIWDKIRVQLANAGAVELADKSAKDLATKFSDMKRRTMEKRDKMNTTGEGHVILTEVNNFLNHLNFNI